MHTLAVSNQSQLTVKLQIQDGPVLKTFPVTLQVTRLDQSDVPARLAEHNNEFKGFVTSVVTGWTSQRLVLDEAGQPAAFSAEALALMLNVLGAAGAIYQAYFQDCGATAKN